MLQVVFYSMKLVENAWASKRNSQVGGHQLTVSHIMRQSADGRDSSRHNGRVFAPDRAHDVST